MNAARNVKRNILKGVLIANKLNRKKNKMKTFNIDFQKQAGKKFTQKIKWMPWPLIHPVAKGVRVELLVRYKNGKFDFDWWDNDEGNWTETIDPSTITHWADICE